jgi:hypothetical protein
MLRRRNPQKTNSFEKEKSIVPVKNPKELFVTILSQVRQGTERSAAIIR